MNLLHYNRRKLPTCFGHLLWASSWCFFEAYYKDNQANVQLQNIKF